MKRGSANKGTTSGGLLGNLKTPKEIAEIQSPLPKKPIPLKEFGTPDSHVQDPSSPTVRNGQCPLPLPLCELIMNPRNPPADNNNGDMYSDVLGLNRQKEVPKSKFVTTNQPPIRPRASDYFDGRSVLEEEEDSMDYDIPHRPTEDHRSLMTISDFRRLQNKRSTLNSSCEDDSDLPRARKSSDPGDELPSTQDSNLTMDSGIFSSTSSPIQCPNPQCTTPQKQFASIKAATTHVRDSPICGADRARPLVEEFMTANYFIWCSQPSCGRWVFTTKPEHPRDHKNRLKERCLPQERLDPSDDTAFIPVENIQPSDRRRRPNPHEPPTTATSRTRNRNKTDYQIEWDSARCAVEYVGRDNPDYDPNIVRRYYIPWYLNNPPRTKAKTGVSADLDALLVEEDTELTTDEKIRRAIAAISDNQSAGDIMKSLRSSGKLPLFGHMEDDRLKLFYELYPKDPSREGGLTFDPDVCNQDDIDVLTVDDLDGIIAGMQHSPSTAISRCGWSDKHFVDVYYKYPDIRIVFAHILTFLIKGEDLNEELEEKLYNKNGCALRKAADSIKARPVSWDNPAVKIAEGFLRKEEEKSIRNEFHPCQLGCGLKAGIEIAIHITRIILQLFVAWTMIRIDSKNAFNSVHTKAVLEAAKRAPKMYRFIFKKYNYKPWIYFENNKIFVISESGVNQGGTASSELFNLIIAGILKDAHSKFPDVIFISICDDIWTLGPLDLATQAAAFIIERLSTVGLESADAKLEVFSYTQMETIIASKDQTRDSYAIGRDPKRGELLICPEGMKILLRRDGVLVGGVPVGTDAFERQTLEDEARLVSNEIDTIVRIIDTAASSPQASQQETTPPDKYPASDNLPHPPVNQAVFDLLCKCTLSQITHLLRGVPPHNTTSVYESLSATVLAAIKRVTNIQNKIDFLQQSPKHHISPEKILDIDTRLLLILSRGGCGIPGDLSQHAWRTSHAAYVGSIAQCLHPILNRFPQLLLRATRFPRILRLSNDIEALFAQVPALQAYETSRQLLADSIPVDSTNTGSTKQTALDLQKLCASISPLCIAERSIDAVQHSLRQLYQQHLQHRVHAFLPHPNERFSTQTNTRKRWMRKRDVVEVMKFVGGALNHYWMAPSRRYRGALFLGHREFELLLHQRVGLPLVIDDPGTKCRCGMALNEAHAMSCKLTRGYRNTLHNDIQVILKNIIKRIGISINTSNQLTPHFRHDPTKIKPITEAQHKIKADQADIILDTHNFRNPLNYPIPRKLFADLTVAGIFRKDIISQYTRPPDGALAVARIKRKLYTERFNFDFPPDISESSLLILSWEHLGACTEETDLFLNFIAGVASQRLYDGRLGYIHWKQNIQRDIAIAIGQNIAYRYLYVATPATAPADIPVPPTLEPTILDGLEEEVEDDLYGDEDEELLVPDHIINGIPQHRNERVDVSISPWGYKRNANPPLHWEVKAYQHALTQPFRRIYYSDGSWTQKDDLCGWSYVCFHVPAGQEVLGVQHLISEDYGRVRIQTHGSQPALHPQVDEDRRPRLPVTQLSNNTAELNAIIMVLHDILTHIEDMHGIPIIICYDSMYARATISHEAEAHVNPSLVEYGYELLTEINKRRRQHATDLILNRAPRDHIEAQRIIFWKVPTHSGVFGNEYADLRSKQGAVGQEGFQGSLNQSPLTPLDMENLISCLPSTEERDRSSTGKEYQRNHEHTMNWNITGGERSSTRSMICRSSDNRNSSSSSSMVTVEASEELAQIEQHQYQEGEQR